MNVTEIKITNITPYENNPRINTKAVDVVASSIAEFGFKNPIVVDKDFVIINGHTRYLASKKLGLEKIPVIIANDLTPEQVKAFRIMDNKSSEFADWDYEKLLNEIKELSDMDYNVDFTGFEEFELDEIEFKMDNLLSQAVGEEDDDDAFDFDKKDEGFVTYKLVLTPEEFDIVKEFISNNSINNIRGEEVLIAMIREAEDKNGLL